MTEFFSNAISPIAAALINGAWISIVLFAVAWSALTVLKNFRPVNAATRYAVWTLTLALVVTAHVIFAVPKADVDRTEPQAIRVFPPDATAASPPAAVIILNDSAAPEVEAFDAPVARTVETSETEASVVTPSREESTPTTTRSRTAISSGLNWRLSSIASWLLACVLGIWGLVATYKLLHLLQSFLAVRRLRRSAAHITQADILALLPQNLSRRIDIRESDDLTSPVAAGPVRASILIPGGLRRRLTLDEFQQILLHEAAHLERRDDWTLLFQRIAECFLFFHPVMWWISARMQAEREVACDEWVVSRTARPDVYVSSISRLVELRLGIESLTLAPGLAADRGSLLSRMRHIMENGLPPSSQLSTRQLAVAGGLLSLVVALILFSSSLLNLSLSFSQEDETPPEMADIMVVEPVADVYILEPLPRADEVGPVPAVPGSLPAVGIFATDTPAPTASFNGPDVPLSASSWIKLLSVAEGIASSGDCARVLGEAALRFPDNLRVYEAYLATARTVASSGDRIRALLHLLEREETEELPYVQLIEAVSGITSSGDRSRALLAILHKAPESEAVHEALLDAVRDITSSGDRERVLSAMARGSN